MKVSSDFRMRCGRGRGTTMIELIVTIAVLAVLVGMAVPIARFTTKRAKERELRRNLWEMRAAIDKYKEAYDLQVFIQKVASTGYPKDLETLVKGEADRQGRKIKFLRAIPVDPMTGQQDWGLRSMQDDYDSSSWGGQDVFDVYSKSEGTALNGTKYKDW